MQHLNMNNILYPLQHGFREKHSCETQLIEFVHNIAFNLQKGVQNDVVMGFVKAFDKVAHNRFLYKLCSYGVKGNTVLDLITAHTPISTQSRNSVVFRLQPVYFFLYFFTKAYVVGTHLNCIDKSMQFKWVPTTYAFVKKVRKNRIVIIK